MNKQFSVIAILLFLTMSAAYAGEIVVQEGQSLHDALRQAREWRRTQDPRCEDGITITVKAGRYYMAEPLFLRPEDSGTAQSPLTIRGEEGTVICGDPRQQHVQLWPREGMERLLDFDTEKRAITIATPPKSVLKQLQKEKHLEMVVHQRWAIAILRVKALTVRGDSVAVTFLEPESRLEFEHPWPQPVIGGERGNSSFLLRAGGHASERDNATLGSVASYVEQLVVVDGASHVTFEGITFEHTCWNRPLQEGHVTLQGGFPLVDAYKLKEHEGLPWDTDLENQAWVERPVSAVGVSHATHVGFSRCHFTALGATALDFIDDTSDCTVTDCHFDDIGGTAIMAGSFAESPREVHRPYTDLAQRCQRLTISGCTISNVGTEDWGAVAIGCGYVTHCTISGNTVSHCPYSGICVGWGWTPAYTGMEHNHIINNKVSDYARQLYDAGGIYTLSNQPYSTIRDNIISQPFPAPYATNDRAFTIYLDARTDGFTITGNRTFAADSSRTFVADSSRTFVVGGSPANTRPIRRDEIGDNHPGAALRYE